MIVRAVGIDPSLSATAVCRMESPGKFDMECFEASEPVKTLAGRMQRYEDLARDVTRRIVLDSEGIVLDGAIVCLEGYGSSARGNAQVPMIEFGATLRIRLLQTIPPLEVAPASVKKFAAGKGNADKMAVALASQKRWGVTFETSDEFDAYVLAVIGLTLGGHWEPQTEQQREVIETLRTGGVKRKKKRGNKNSTQIGSNDNERTDRRIHGSRQT